jgi:ribonuclease HI
LGKREEWKKIKGETLLLQGVRAEWKDGQSAARLAREFALHTCHPQKSLRAEYMKLLAEEIEEGTVREVKEEDVKWLNPTFLVPKAGGKWRKILDCRRLNEEMRDRHFKMESALDVLEIARAGDWATSLDFRAAFNHIAVDPELRPYLCFHFAGRFFQYQAMPFGLKQAPRTFTRLMKRAVTAVREKWRVRMIFYMDDSLLLFSTKEQAKVQTKQIAAFFTSLGWTLAHDKCQMEPVQIIDFLGWRWDCSKAHLSTVPKRRTTLIKEVEQMLEACRVRSRIPTRKLAALIGQLNFLQLQNRDAGLHIKMLDVMKIRSVRKTGWSGWTTMHPGAQGDLKWWLRALHLNSPRAWQPPLTKATLTTDASPSGWGAELRRGDSRSYAFGQWKEQQRWMSSNAKELTAVRMALGQFREEIQEMRPLTLTVQSDNTTTVHIINNRRAALSLCTPLRNLLNRARQLQTELRAIYLPGVQNDTADRLSRMGRLTGFHLQDSVLTELLREAEFEPTLDVFAREPILWERTEAAERQEAAALLEGHGASLNWTGECLFLHPPLHRIAATLRRLQREPTPALLITPNWGSQPWSPILAEMVERRFHLGPYNSVMATTPEFRQAGWRLPPGEVVASILATRTTRERDCSMSFSS